MIIAPITSAANPLLKRIRSLHQRSGRRKAGQFLIEGPRSVCECFQKGVPVRDVIVSKTYLEAGLPGLEQEEIDKVTMVDDRLFADLVTTTTPCGVVAAADITAHKLDECLKAERTFVLIGESIQDPGNTGTMLRAAQAFGATGVVLTRGSVDPYSPKVVRAAMGALFAVPVVSEVSMDLALAALKEIRARVIALEPEGKRKYWELAGASGPLALIAGNEGQGLSSSALEAADDIVMIPMEPHTESLNVAVSAAIVMAHCYRMRNA